MKQGEMSIQQMKSPSKSLQRLWLNDYIVDPYINLANAIVSIAADDFRTALEENNIDLQKSLEQFFYSSWYSILTKIEPDVILERIKEEFEAGKSLTAK